MTRAKAVSRYAFGALFIVAGASHFLHTPFYAGVVPSYLPWPRALVYVSGAAEIVLGALVCRRQSSAVAAWGLIALLVAVFPANIQMAQHPELHPSLPVPALWLRLPAQGALIAWAYWYTRKNGRASPEDVTE